MKTAPRPVSRQEFDRLFEQLSNWGRWGSDDERGTLNYIKPEHIQSAARLVRAGRSVSLSLPINKVAGPDNPRPALHYMIHRHDVDIPEGAPRFATDFMASEFHGDSFTHIDALCHVSHQGRLYNGKPASSVTGLGAKIQDITAFAHGIVGRGVLLDIPPAARGPMAGARRGGHPGRARGGGKVAGGHAGGRRYPAVPHRSSPTASGVGSVEQRLQR